MRSKTSAVSILTLALAFCAYGQSLSYPPADSPWWQSAEGREAVMQVRRICKEADLPWCEAPEPLPECRARNEAWMRFEGSDAEVHTLGPLYAAYQSAANECETARMVAATKKIQDSVTALQEMTAHIGAYTACRHSRRWWQIWKPHCRF